jgi:protein TonB
LSVVAHTLLIAVWAAETLPVDSLPIDSLANRVYYIPPPDRPPTTRGAKETITYISFDEGTGSGPGPESVDPRKPIRAPEHSAVAGPHPADSVSQVAGPAEVAGDSVFTVLEVDSAVVRSQNSAAPAYPLELLAKHVEGMVLARYIVDTTGFADVNSLDIVKSTNAGFENAVRAALPYMRFSPAKIGDRRVRQLVEQPFTFRITGLAAEPPKASHNPPR